MSEPVEAIAKMQFAPWDIPSDAILILPGAEGERQTAAVPRDHLRMETIDALAERWLRDLYAAVESTSPWERRL